MAWHITVDFDDRKPRKEGWTAIHSLPVAVETVLREMGLSEHTGSIQITVADTEAAPVIHSRDTLPGSRSR